MFAKEIIAMMTKEEKTAYNTIKQEGMTAIKAIAPVLKDKNAPKADVLMAKSIKSEMTAKVQEFLDKMYFKSIVRSTPVESIRAYLTDPYRPIADYKIDKDACVSFVYDKDSMSKVFPYNSMIEKLATHFNPKDEDGKPINEKPIAIPAPDFDKVRQMTGGFAIQCNIDNSGESRENLVDAYAAYYDIDGIGESGRNATEKAWQAMIDTLVGLTDDGRVYIRAKKTMILDFIMIDHIFDRRPNGSVALVSGTDFANRVVHILHETLTDKDMEFVAPKTRK